MQDNDKYLLAPLYMSWSGPRMEELALKLSSIIAGTPPDELSVDGGQINASNINSSSFETLIRECKLHAVNVWNKPARCQLSLDRVGLVKLARYNFVPVISDTLELLKNLSFHVCVGGARYSEWFSTEKSEQYPRPMVEPGHYAYGWMVALKGEGHRHLVSKRWLEHGPLRVIREADVTLVQFHDLKADPDTALEQATSGHAWMSDGLDGGFVRSDLEPIEDKEALYDADERSMNIVIMGRDLTAQEIKEACTARAFRGVSDEQPIEHLAYVFMEEDRARRHLHDLWLRDIDCRTFIHGREVSLSADYEPPAPVVPDWVKRVQDREGR